MGASALLMGAMGAVSKKHPPKKRKGANSQCLTYGLCSTGSTLLARAELVTALVNAIGNGLISR